MLDLSGGLIKSERCRHHAAKPRGFYLNRLSELLLPLLPRALVGLAPGTVGATELGEQRGARRRLLAASGGLVTGLELVQRRLHLGCDDA